jgi:alkanesulfonate monooxygenase SsuD/methylene tetrahydromethanopterin reductase-like flavin-dependent oxidoreductase (luciferase family)
VKLGITLPSFREDPETALEVAGVAERAGVDGVFAFDHLFREARDGTRRPALECHTLLGAVAAETRRIAFGPFVARATLRPPATLAAALDTLDRIGGGRLIATIGSGDAQSRGENESFGLPFGSVEERLVSLGATVGATRGRGYPVWVGGDSYAVRLLAASDADGWNRWGAAAGRFAREAQAVREHVERAPREFTVSWGGQIVLGATEAEADAKRARLEPAPSVLAGGPERVAEAIRAYGDAGAEWAIVGPVDSSDPDNAAVLGERVKPLLRP